MIFSMALRATMLFSGSRIWTTERMRPVAGSIVMNHPLLKRFSLPLARGRPRRFGAGSSSQKRAITGIPRGSAGRDPGFKNANPDQTRSSLDYSNQDIRKHTSTEKISADRKRSCLEFHELPRRATLYQRSYSRLCELRPKLVES